MAMKRNHSRVLEIGKGAVTGALCLLIAAPQAFAAGDTSSTAKVATPVRTVALTQDEKALHELNRFTFGPRPGDEQKVREVGLDAWFEWQLHPEQISDADLDARLDQFPALKLSPGDLMRRYPSPQILKQMERQGTPLPSDPVEHAIYADSMAFYNAAQKKQAAGLPVAGNAAGLTDMAAGNDANVMAASKQMADNPAAPMETNAVAPKGKGQRKLNEPAMDRDDVEALIALPSDQRMARLVAMSPEEMVSFREGVKPFEVAALMQGLTAQQKQDVAAMQGGARVIGAEALEERMLRDVYSDRQLQAVMDDFWLNHFSVYARKNQNEPYLLASYERDAILPNSLGKFENLLVATAKSPAMLVYLDNWQSIGPDSQAALRGKRFSATRPDSKLAQAMPKGINENYARELMELHTLGVGGGYTQQDVIEVAKCFTGWTIDRPYQGGSGEAIFDESRHEGGSKTVLGHVIKENGSKEGMEVLHILATSPATAHFISTKLAQRFVSDTPPASMVDRMAAAFLQSDGDIKAVLRTMFHSPEFWSPAVYRAKVKTPIEFVASALRASNAEIANPIALVQAMQQLGMPIYGMQTPNGYSWQADQWVSSNALVSRMNFALVLSGGRLRGTRVDWPQVLGDSENPSIAASPTPKTEEQLETVILGQPAGVHTRQTVLATFNDPTVQRTAAKNFAKTAEAPDAADADDDMAGAGKLMRVKSGRGGGYGQGFQADKPETPLDTMAGLLLGSPDFQRR